MSLERLGFERGQNRWRIMKVWVIAVAQNPRYGRWYGRARPYLWSLNLLFSCSVLVVISSNELRFGLSWLVGIVSTSSTLQLHLILIWASWKNDHFPSHFTSVWCLVTFSDSSSFVSFHHVLFINSTYKYIDTKTRETSKILIKPYGCERTIGKWELKST